MTAVVANTVQISRPGPTGSRFLSTLVLLLLCTACSLPARAASTPTPEPSPLPTVTGTATSFPTPTSEASRTPEPSPTPGCSQPAGWIERSVYPGAVVDAELPLQVYLPPCYDSQDESYPVLYVLHGYPFDETHWEQLGMIERVDAGIRDLGWRPFLIIMPGAPDVLFINSDGGPGSYEAEFLGGLLPFVETHYAVVTSGSERAIAGISRGGVWALEIGFRHPELFNTVAALSPALQVNYARPDYDPYILVSRSESLPANILLSAGDAEWSFSQATERLAEMLSERGAPYVYVHASGGHDAANWEGVIGDMLLFLTEAWHLQE